MPRITVRLASTYENISRPVAMSVAKDVMRICDIDPSVPIYMRGEFEQINQPGTNIGEDDEIRFDSAARVSVVAEDSVRNSSLLSQVVRSNEFPPFFEDRDLGISIRPVYVESDLRLNFKYVAATRQQAQHWLDDFAIRKAENRESIHHEITYDIPIHDSLLSLLAHLHELRERVSGYGEDFGTYFQKMKQVPLEMVGAIDGDHDKLLLVRREKQASITGWFDFSDIPKEQKTADNVTWEIEFSYNLCYNRCTHFYVVYPLMIHQSRISKKYFSMEKRFSVEELIKGGALGMRALDTMDGRVNHLPPPAGGIRIPHYDDWIPNEGVALNWLKPAITWLISVNPQRPTELMSLRDTPLYEFTKEIDDYMTAVHDVLHIRGGAALHISLYIDDVQADPSMITIDADLNVRAVRPLDLRKVYHVRLSYVTSARLLTQTAKRTLERHPFAALQIFQSMIPSLDVEWISSKLLAGPILPADYIDWTYQYLEDKNVGNNNPYVRTKLARISTNDPGVYAGSNRSSPVVPATPSQPPVTLTNNLPSVGNLPSTVQVFSILAMKK